MKHILFFSAFIASLLIISCNGGAQPASGKSAPSKGSTATSANFVEGADYQVFERARIMDRKGFEQPAEAFSLLLPKGWKVESEIIWNGPGSGCDGTNHRVRAASSDGKYSFQVYPVLTWGWTSNAELREMQQQLPKGPTFCSYGPPMDATEYLRNKFVPQELNNAEVVSVNNNQAVVEYMGQGNDKARREMMNYGAANVQFRQTAITAKLKWDDGTSGIALCGISIMENVVPNVYTGGSDQSSTSSASVRIVFRFPTGEEAQAEKMLSVIMSSYRTNPSWRDAVNGFWKDVREKSHVAHVGRLRMMDEQTRAMGNAAIRRGNDRLRDMDVQMRSWEEKQQSQDRIHTEFIKTIRGVENYRDATGKVELSSGYDHAWSRGDGSSFIMTNKSTFDPSSVFQDQEWKEMKKVD